MNLLKELAEEELNKLLKETEPDKQIYEVIVDEHGFIIDGQHRDKASKHKWKRRLVTTGSKKNSLILRAKLNSIRRGLAPNEFDELAEEIRDNEEIAKTWAYPVEEFRFKYGQAIPPGKIAQVISSLTGVNERRVRRHLSKGHKQMSKSRSVVATSTKSKQDIAKQLFLRRPQEKEFINLITNKLSKDDMETLYELAIRDKETSVEEIYWTNIEPNQISKRKLIVPMSLIHGIERYIKRENLFTETVDGIVNEIILDFLREHRIPEEEWIASKEQKKELRDKLKG